MKLADKIVALRKKHSMTQEDMAEQLHVSRQAASRWEMGTAMPDAANLRAIGNRLIAVRRFEPAVCDAVFAAHLKSAAKK